MASKMENPALETRGNPVADFAASKVDPETNLTALRAQYLAEVFALPSDTACVLAELAFGAARS